jgi:hypothetical protein
MEDDMDMQMKIRHFTGIVTAAAAALSLLLAAGSASAQASTPTLGVAVFAEHYVLEGRVIDDLDVLEVSVRDLYPRAVRLDACGDGTERAQRAAAHRLRHLYLELRVLEAGSPDCPSPAAAQAVLVSQRAGTRPFGIDDAAVDRWWHQLMP